MQVSILWPGYHGWRPCCYCWCSTLQGWPLHPPSTCVVLTWWTPFTSYVGNGASSTVHTESTSGIWSTCWVRKLQECLDLCQHIFNCFFGSWCSKRHGMTLAQYQEFILCHCSLHKFPFNENTNLDASWREKGWESTCWKLYWTKCVCPNYHYCAKPLIKSLLKNHQWSKSFCF